MRTVGDKKIQSFKDLLVWQKDIQITDEVYRITAKFPELERFGLVTQMQRSAVSIPSNVAEGFGRRHTKELQRFCRVALGSCCELETQLIIAKRRNYLSEETFIALQGSIDHESRMLMNLIKGLYD